MDNDQKDVVHGTLVTYGDVCDVRFVFVGVKTFGPPSSSSSDEMIIIGLSIDKESGQLLLDLDRFVSDGTWHSPSLSRRKDLVFHSTFHSIPRSAFCTLPIRSGVAEAFAAFGAVSAGPR